MKLVSKFFLLTSLILSVTLSASAQKTTKKSTTKKIATQTKQDADLTFVPRLQSLGKRLLEKRQGSIIAIRPQTGEVICMVSNSLDGKDFNRAVSGSYPPGSTFKAAQELVLWTEGIIDADTKVECHRGFMMGGTHVGCHAHPSPLSTRQALAQSCNSWFITNFINMISNTTKYGTRSHALNVWHEYMRSFGLGDRLGIDVPGEARGLIPDSAYVNKRYPKFWNARTIGYCGMGQDLIVTTPLQLCNLAAIIANRGWWITPYTHYSTAGSNPEKYITPNYTLASPDAFDEVVAGMRACVTGGTAKNINDPRITICGKTGTAQNNGIDHSAFIAFAPMNKPQIAICVYIEHGGDGNKTAAPIAAQIIKSYLQPHRRSTSTTRKRSTTSRKKYTKRTSSRRTTRR